MGFAPDTAPGAPICRFIYMGIQVDIMPVKENILGFTNQWYEEGFCRKTKHRLPNQDEIYILTLPYFIATKIEAFKGRGASDPRLSHDLEDIVMVLVNIDRNKLLIGASENLKEYLKNSFNYFLNSDTIMEAISGHNPYRHLGDSFQRIVDTLKIEI